MKKLFLLVLIVSLSSCGTFSPKYFDPEPESYEVKVNEEKEHLFVKSNNWMVQYFKSPESVIQFSDKNYAVINGKYNYLLTSTMGNKQYEYIHLRIDARDNRVRLIVDPLPVRYADNYALNEIKQKVEAVLIEISDDFESYMNNNKLLKY